MRPSQRLRRLEQTGVLQRHATSRGKRTEYRLTAAGRELKPIIDSFCAWGARWAFGPPRPNELDPLVLLWWMRRRVCFEQIPRRRVVIQLDFRGVPHRRYWLLIELTEASICLQHPGFDVDVIVTADISVLYKVWMGRMLLEEAIRRNRLRLDGTPSDIQAFPRWFARSRMAETVRAALTDPAPPPPMRGQASTPELTPRASASSPA